MPQRNSRRRKSSVHRQRDRFNANDAMWGGSPPPPAPSLRSEMSMPYYTGAVGPDGKPEDHWRGKPPGRNRRYNKFGKKSAKKSKKSKKTKKSKKRSTKRSKKRSNRR